MIARLGHLVFSEVAACEERVLLCSENFSATLMLFGEIFVHTLF